MAYVPKNTRWYLATLVEEITVKDESLNVVHKNLVLIRADSPEESYAKAMSFGAESQMEYDNPQGRRVTGRFIGLAQLSVVYDKLEDGAELQYEEAVGVAKADLQAMIRRKEDLSVFRPITASAGPDYSSADVLRDVSELRRRIGSAG